MNTAKAFSPSGISGFFEVCDKDENGRLIEDPLRIGARGGGIGIAKGVTTKVSVEASKENAVEVYINDRSEEARTTGWVVNDLLKRTKRKYLVHVEHLVEVPIGSGFGTSAAGAFSCGLALSKVLKLNLTYNQIARVAHVADVVSHTGLGTVEGLTVGGVSLIVKSGAVGIGLIDRIPVSPKLKIVAGSFQAIDKKTVILSDKVEGINLIARRTMDDILASPSLENFLRRCKAFAIQTGLASQRVSELIDDVEKAGAVGASQNMIGDAVHAVVKDSKLKAVHDVFKSHMSEDKIVVSKIDLQGARLLD